MGAWGYNFRETDGYADWEQKVFDDAAVALVNKGKEDPMYVAAFLEDVPKHLLMRIKDKPLKEAYSFVKAHTSLVIAKKLLAKSPQKMVDQMKQNLLFLEKELKRRQIALPAAAKLYYDH